MCRHTCLYRPGLYGYMCVCVVYHTGPTFPVYRAGTSLQCGQCPWYTFTYTLSCDWPRSVHLWLLVLLQSTGLEPRLKGVLYLGQSSHSQLMRSRVSNLGSQNSLHVLSLTLSYPLPFQSLENMGRHYVKALKVPVKDH